MVGVGLMSFRIAPTVQRLLLVQCLTGVALAALLFLWDVQAAYSALTGAAIGFLPNLYLALRVFDLSKGRSARSTLRAFYIGAAGKFIVTVALFIVALRLISPLNVLAMFGGFIAIQVVHWATPLLVTDPGRAGD